MSGFNQRLPEYFCSSRVLRRARQNNKQLLHAMNSAVAKLFEKNDCEFIELAPCREIPATINITAGEPCSGEIFATRQKIVWQPESMLKRA